MYNFYFLGVAYGRNKSGWSDLEILQEWFEKILVPHVRKLEGLVVLIGDNLSSHLSLSVIRRCQDENIRFVLLPANSTHICQHL